MDIQTLIEKYGHLNRLIGGYRESVNNSVRGTQEHNESAYSLTCAKERMATVEDQLQDLGLLHFSDRYTDREYA